ncbi:MAG: hypothetical protein JWO03_1862 [Bacteroidetes bacterium]|nr:hypothetical protein [Bacteroidota bacterium]
MRAGKFILLFFFATLTTVSTFANELDDMGADVPLDNKKEAPAIVFHCADLRNPYVILSEFANTLKANKDSSKIGEAVFNACTKEKMAAHYDSLPYMITEGEIFTYAAEHDPVASEKLLLRSIGDWWFQQVQAQMQDTLAKNPKIQYDEEFIYLATRMKRDHFNIQLPAESYSVKVTKDMMKGEYGYIIGRVINGTSWKVKLLLITIILFFSYFFIKGIYHTIKKPSIQK